MKKTFLSYAQQDRAMAVRLWDELKWRGLDAWLDINEIRPGTPRSWAIEHAVSGCDFFLLLLTRDAFTSRHVRRQVLLAVEQERVIIPLRFEDCSAPSMIEDIQPVDFSDYSTGFRRLVRALPSGIFQRDPSVENIIENLHNTSPDVRRTTAFLVGKQKIRRATDRVVTLLRDSNPDVRTAAAWALDQLSDPRTKNDLVASLEDPAFDVRSAAGWALVNMGALVVPDVVSVLRDSPHDGAREMAYQILVRLGGEQADEAIRLYWQA